MIHLETRYRSHWVVQPAVREYRRHYIGLITNSGVKRPARLTTIDRRPVLKTRQRSIILSFLAYNGGDDGLVRIAQDLAAARHTRHAIERTIANAERDRFVQPRVHRWVVNIQRT